MERRKLEEMNHWWFTKKVDPQLALSFKRDIYGSLITSLDQRFIIALVGLRRIGKTTLLYQLIQHLIDQNVPVENIVFFSFDETAATLADMLQTYQEIQQKNLREERIYIFLDEIQKHDNWENELKKYYDLYPKMKLIISGSESLFIRKKTKETLAGRIFEYKLTPFIFSEYLRLHQIEKKYESRAVDAFQKFILIGGFPETFSLNEKDFREYIRSLVVDKIIYKDIPKIFNLEDPEFLGILLELVSTNPGLQIDYQSLSQQFGKDRRVIKNYFSYLQSSFLVVFLGNYRKGKTASLRKKKKAYPTDIAFCTLYSGQNQAIFVGKVIETLIVNSLSAKDFWKNGTEIDIIHHDFPIEVKYQEQISPSDWKPLLSFMRKFGKKIGILITKNHDQEIQEEEGIIKLIPAWRFILNFNGSIENIVTEVKK